MKKPLRSAMSSSSAAALPGLLPRSLRAGPVRAYLALFAVAPGRRLVVFTTTDDGWRTAIDAHAAGLAIAAVVDARPQAPQRHVEALAGTGARIVFGGRVIAARGGRSVT